MHRHFVVGLLQVLCSILGSEVNEHRLNSGLERSASEGSNNGTGQYHLDTLEQFLNNLESRMGVVEGEISSVKGKTSSLEGDMSTVKANQARSRCQTDRLNLGTSIDDRNDAWKLIDNTVTFSTAFRHTPKIILSVTYADIYKPHAGDVKENLMSSYKPLDITKSSFKLRTELQSQGSGKWYFYQIKVSWMACE